MSSATDIANFLACGHLTSLERAEAAGEVEKPYTEPDVGLELLVNLGLAHEKAYLRRLTEDEGLDVVRISEDLSLRQAADTTLQAIREGAAAIYQASFLDEPWRARADFLIRVDRSSTLGSWSYEVVETKLARSTKPRALIQLCLYSELLSKVQGIAPEFMYVVLGGKAAAEKFPSNAIMPISER